MEIRLATAQDVAAIRNCVAEAYNLYLERMATPPAPMLDDYEALVGREVVHVATGDDQLLGVIVMWPETDHVYVDNIAVATNAQGAGVAAALLAAADDLACQHHRAELRLYTNVAMTENLDYYPRRGFTETHRQTDAGYDRVYYRREVQVRNQAE